MKYIDVEHAFYKQYPEGLLVRNINNFENKVIQNSFSVKYNKNSKMYNYNETVEGLYQRLNLNDIKLDKQIEAKNNKHEAWKNRTKWDENNDEF